MKPPRVIIAVAGILLILVVVQGVHAAAPVASFNANRTSGTVPLSVSFTDLSPGIPDGWAWYFGDEPFTEPWTLKSASSGWTLRMFHSSVVMPDGDIVLMGGYDGSFNESNDVWRSNDNGATWTRVNASAGWTPREGHTSVVMPDGSIVLMGGLGETTYKNDVWRSTDKGATWQQATDSAMWTARYAFSSVVVPDGSIVLMGGYDGSYNDTNDIWRSNDNGVTWAQVTDNAGWTARNGHSSVVMPDGSIILTGGVDSEGYKNDTWRSMNNGLTWSMVNASSGWTGRDFHSSVVMPDGSIVLTGGLGYESEPKGDVWRSTDNGATWTQVTASPGWPGREGHSSVAMPDGSIVMTGGYVYDNGDYECNNDTWQFMPAGSSEQNPSHTYTLPGNYTVALQVSNTDGYNSTLKTGFITVTGTSAPVANGTIIDQYATVFIGEEGLNVTHALNQAQGSPVDGVPPFTSIGWWAAGDPFSTSPSHMIDLAGQYTSFTVAPADFVNFAGTWYVVGDSFHATGPAFYVADPMLDLKIWDITQARDVTGTSVPTGTRLGFRIDTNMYAAVNETYRSPINPATDGFINIKVKPESGAVLTALYNDSASAGSLAGPNTLLKNFVNVQPYYWGSPGTYSWKTDAMNNGSSFYLPGTYTVWAESTLNNMKNIYLNNGSVYIGKTVSPVYAITLIPSAIHADYIVNTTSGTKPLTVKFTDISTGGPTNVWMDFGDGTTSGNIVSPGYIAHTFTNEGTFFPVIHASNNVSSDFRSNDTISVNVVVPMDPGLVNDYKTVLNNASILNGTPSGKSVFASPVLPAGSMVQTWGEKPPIVIPTAGRIIFIDDYPGANWEHPGRYVHVNNLTGNTTVYEGWSPPTNLALDQIAGVVSDPGSDANSVTSASPNPGGGLGPLNLTAACTNPNCSHNYALLISGGFNTSQNHLRYWNDISFMYQTLNQTYGYPASHITVLMSDGTSSAYDRHNATLANGTIKTDTSPLNLDGNYNSVDVNGDAKKATVIAKLRTLNGTLTPADNLFIFTTSHGGWDTVRNSNNSILYLWNQEYINDTEFVANMPKNAGNITMVMEQCYSGGFIDNFIDRYTGVSQGRVIITAANSSEPSWGNGFSNTWTSGMARIDEQRNLNLNADTSPADGKISMWEAYNYSLKYDPSANPLLPYHEHPQYSAKNPPTAGTNRFLSTCPGSTSRTIKLTKPAMAETWNIGTQRLITWTYTGLSSTEPVNISLWKGTTSKTLQRYIAQVPAKTGSYTWTVPTVATGTDYWINISSASTPVVSNRSPTFALAAAGMIGTVKVNTMPVQGANISINGMLNRATTNTTISLTPGDHNISVKKSGYYGAWSWITVRSGSTLPVNFVLEEVGANDYPPYGTIVIDSSIPGAGIFIDGENTGLVTPAKTEILNGTHNVSVTSYGYISPPKQSVVVPPHETVNLAFTFTEVSNVAPLVDAGPDATGYNGTPFTSGGFFTDSGPGPWSATVNYGDGTGSLPLNLSGKEFGLSHMYTGTGIFTVTVMVTDQNNKIGSDIVTVTVKPLDIGYVTRIGVFRPSKNQFYLDYNGNGVWNGGVNDRSYIFGLPGDIPLSGDWNGNGKTKIGVFRPSTHQFYLDYNGNGAWNGASVDRQYNFGITGDTPVSGDWNNDGKTEIGVFRNSTHLFYLDYNGNGVWNGIVTDQQYNFGTTGDIPVSGDWNADGRTEIGVFRNSTHLFYLDYNGNGVWSGDAVDRQYNFGLTGDLPISGDWNANRMSEIGVFRPSTHIYYLDSNGNGVWNGALTEKAHNFGLNGDLPVFGNWA